MVPDWWRGTSEGPQRWETFHLDAVRPFIEARYQTRTDRDGRAIAGLSMGGFGAMSYAARHPDLFGFAASFSGAVDLLHPGITAVVTISPLAHEGVPGDVFGLRFLEESRWRAHNPVDLAANLRSVEIQLRTGNGQPGGPHGGSLDPQEAGVSQATVTLHQRLDALDIPHLYSTTARAPIPGRIGVTTSPLRCRESRRSLPEHQRCPTPRNYLSAGATPLGACCFMKPNK